MFSRKMFKIVFFFIYSNPLSIIESVEEIINKMKRIEEKSLKINNKTIIIYSFFRFVSVYLNKCFTKYKF